MADIAREVITEAIGKITEMPPRVIYGDRNSWPTNRFCEK